MPCFLSLGAHSDLSFAQGPHLLQLPEGSPGFTFGKSLTRSCLELAGYTHLHSPPTRAGSPAHGTPAGTPAAAPVAVLSPLQH